MAKSNSSPAARQQARFFGRVANLHHTLALFDYLPDVFFFIKDSEGQFMRVNRALLEVLGVRDETRIVGATDYDYFPQDLADRYLAEDRRVMSLGRPLTNQVWAVPDAEGTLRWYVASKAPLLDGSGAAVGVAGAMRDAQGAGALVGPYQQMEPIIRRIMEGYAQAIRVADLAQMVHLSVSQFNRRFRELFHASPAQYIARVRTNAACRLLTRTGLPLSEIAERTGFYDASHFGKRFKRSVGVTPDEYRRRHAVEGARLSDELTGR